MEDSNNEALLIELRKSRDPAIRQHIIISNFPLVYRVLKELNISSNHQNFEDLLQVGMIGLIKAVDDFDVHKGTKFSTFATYKISGEVRHYLRDNIEKVRKPRWLTKLYIEILKTAEMLTGRLGRSPTLDEIARECNIKESSIIEVFNVMEKSWVLSLEEIQEKYGHSLIGSMIKSREYQTFRLPIEDRLILEEAFNKLKELEKKIIYFFFFKDLTQIQIGNILGLPQRKVSRILKVAIEKLKNFLQQK